MYRTAESHLDPIILRLQVCDSPFLNCDGFVKGSAADDIVHGAALSKINPENLDCEAASYGSREARIDALGPGFAFCACSGEGRAYRIYFMSAMKPTSAEIEFRVVRLPGVRCRAIAP